MGSQTLVPGWQIPRGCRLSYFSPVQLCATVWISACQAPLSMGFSRQEYWSGLPYFPPGDLPDPGSEPESPMSNLRWQAGSLPLAPPGKSQRERYLGSAEAPACSTQRRSLGENQGAWTVGAHSLWIIAGSLSHSYQIYSKFSWLYFKSISRIRPFHHLRCCHPDLTTLMMGVKKVKDLNCRGKIVGPSVGKGPQCLSILHTLYVPGLQHKNIAGWQK